MKLKLRREILRSTSTIQLVQHNMRVVCETIAKKGNLHTYNVPSNNLKRHQGRLNMQIIFFTFKHVNQTRTNNVVS
jgi:hypothetical protein